MESKAGAKAERANPWSAALRLLTRRDYSRSDLRQRLRDKGFEQDLIEAALQRCLELGYLDDQRYAPNRATSLMCQGRAVGRRVLFDLRKHGIDEEVANRALEQAREVCNEASLLASLLEKRFPGFSYNAAPDKERRRVVHFLQRRGFTIDCIMKELLRKGLETNNEDR